MREGLESRQTAGISRVPRSLHQEVGAAMMAGMLLGPMSFILSQGTLSGLGGAFARLRC